MPIMPAAARDEAAGSREGRALAVLAAPMPEVAAPLGGGVRGLPAEVTKRLRAGGRSGFPVKGVVAPGVFAPRPVPAGRLKGDSVLDVKGEAGVLSVGSVPERVSGGVGGLGVKGFVMS